MSGTSSDLKQHDNKDKIDFTNHKELVKLTSRTFFNDAEIIVLDYLNALSYPAVTNHDLRNYLHVKDKDIHRICSREHRQKEKGTRPPLPGVAPALSNIGTGGGDIYVLDYKLFVNVLSLLLVELTHRIERSINHAIDTRGYVCPVCSRQYPLQEAFEQQVPITLPSGEQSFIFVCTAHPSAELIEDQSLLADEPPELKLLNLQLKPLLQLIELCRKVPVPEYNRSLTLQVIRQHQLKARIERDALRLQSVPGTLYSDNAEKDTIDSDHSSTGSTSTILIEFADSTSDPNKAIKDAQVLNNRLPEWHRVSTVTGESISSKVKPSPVQPNWANGQKEFTVDVAVDVEESTNDDEQYVAKYLNRMLSQSENTSMKRPFSEDMDDQSYKRFRFDSNGETGFLAGDDSADNHLDDEEDIFEDVEF